MCFKIKIFVLNQQQGAQIIWKKYLKFESSPDLGTVLKIAGVAKNFCQGFPLYTFFEIEKSFKIKFFGLNQQQGAQIIWKKYLKFEERPDFGTVAC